MERRHERPVPADFSLLPTVAAVRDVLPGGELLARHVWNVMPFDNRVVTLEIPGDQLDGLTDPPAVRTRW